MILRSGYLKVYIKTYKTYTLVYLATSYTVKIQYSPEHDLEFSNHLLWSIPFSNRCQHFIKLLKDLLPFLKIRFSSKTYTLSNLSYRFYLLLGGKYVALCLLRALNF